MVTGIRYGPPEQLTELKWGNALSDARLMRHLARMLPSGHGVKFYLNVHVCVCVCDSIILLPARRPGESSIYYIV